MTHDDVPTLLVQDETLPVAEAFTEARRLIRGATIINTYLTHAGQDIRDEVTAYLAECLLAGRPVSLPYALKELGHWESFKANIFRVFALEEEALAESAGEGVPLEQGDVEILRETTKSYSRDLVAA